MHYRSDNECNYTRCREKITITGQQCRYCTRRYCFKHHLPEIHGCEEEARHHIRGQTLRSKVVTNGSGVRERKVDPAHRASLEKRMENTIGKMADKRQRNQKKKWLHWTLNSTIKKLSRCYSGSTSVYEIVLSSYNQRVGGSSPPSASARRQGILSTIVSRDPGVVNGYLVGIYSLKCFSASGCRG